MNYIGLCLSERVGARLQMAGNPYFLIETAFTWSSQENILFPKRSFMLCLDTHQIWTSRRLLWEVNSHFLAVGANSRGQGLSRPFINWFSMDSSLETFGNQSKIISEKSRIKIVVGTWNLEGRIPDTYYLRDFLNGLATRFRGDGADLICVATQ